MAFEQARGVEYLVWLAQEDPKTFVPLRIMTMRPEPKMPKQDGLNIHIDLTQPLEAPNGASVWGKCGKPS